MKWSKVKTTIVLSLSGLLLGASKLIWLSFNFLEVLELFIFLAVGYALGGKVAGGWWSWGVLLVLPAFALVVARLSYSNILTSIGTGYVVSLVLMPLGACIGIALGAKRAPWL